MEAIDREDRKKNKGGRPAVPVKKDTIVRVRFDKQEYFILRQKAKKAGLTLSAFLRMAASRSNIRARLSAEEQDVARKLAGMSWNFNQLVKEFHKAGVLKTVAHFELYRTRIDELFERLRK